jgi:asparagine synthase (glutamine-hydrolysing)
VFRYVAFVWDDEDAAARGSAGVFAERLQASSPEWAPVLSRKGLQVFCAGIRAGSSEAYRLHQDAGVVLGKLFKGAVRRDGDASSTSVPLCIAEDESLKVAASNGRRLIEAYWGRYVAFLQDETASVTRVIRDPTATLPCFTARLAGVQVYFSRMEDAAQLGSHRFSVNWKYIAGALCQSQLQVHLTGLNEVSQVLGGECVEHREGRLSRTFYWNSIEIAGTQMVEDASEAAATLRAVSRDCVHSWASSYRGILHLLSGGLDSSIILACLKDAPTRPKMACLNYYSPGSNTDERGYAQLAASAAGCELVERERNSSVSLESLLRIRKTPMPRDYFFYLDEGRCEADLARSHGAGAVFTGYGGDQLFYQARATFAAADFLMSHGASPALFEVALDAARMDRKSVWHVLGKAAGTRWLGRRWRVQDEQCLRPTSLIRREVAQDISRYSDLVHPWLREQGRAPDGKKFHAYQLLFPADFYNPLGSDSDPESVTPLFSQPLLELAMRMPTWLLTRGGWDRAVARRAFQHDVPRPIVTRRTKGGQEEHAKTILLRNFAFARSLLLDGYLVRERILERDQVTEALSAGPTRLANGNVELYGCLSAEAWIRHWTTR